MKPFQLSFNASGHVIQQVTPLFQAITPQEIVKGLASGEYITTIQDGDTFIEEIATGKPVARIDNVDNHLTYEDYTLD